MGILRLLGFGHPLTDLLEKGLTQALVDQYKDIASQAGGTAAFQCRKGAQLQVVDVWMVFYLLPVLPEHVHYPRA